MPRTIIAEIGQNHMGDMGLAKLLISAAKSQGADVAKFQLYDSVALYGEHQSQELTREQVVELSEHCGNVGIEFLCSVFDVDRIQWCEDVGVKRYKIASRSVDDESLIEAVLGTGKPTIISIPYGRLFDSVVARYKDYMIGCLYCIPEYPAELGGLHLADVQFRPYTKSGISQPCYLGFSDHTKGIIASEIALCRGAYVIEKHFRLDNNPVGPDYPHSIIPYELGELVRFAQIIDIVM